MASERPPSTANAAGAPPAGEQGPEAEKSERFEMEQDSRLRMTVREAEVIAQNLKESGTRR